MNAEFYIPYEYIQDIPREKLKDLFKEYWYTIYELELESKPSIHSSMTGYKVLIASRCFACEYSVKFRDPCLHCPLKDYTELRKKYDDYAPCIVDGPYVQYEITKNPKYALEIAKLPWTDA